MSEKKLIKKDQVFNFIEEFKKFAFKGNIIDLSMGVIIGGSFAKIVSSLVDNIIMPVISLITPSGNSYKDWSLKVLDKSIPYGLFVSDVVTFLIVSFVLFFTVKKFLVFIFEREKKEKIEKANEKIETNKKESEIDVLLEIRDLIKQKSIPLNNTKKTRKTTKKTTRKTPTKKKK